MATSCETQPLEVFPKIVPAGRRVTVDVRLASHGQGFKPHTDYVVSHFPSETYATLVRSQNTITCRTEDGVLHVARKWQGEQEHVLTVEELSKGKTIPLGSVRVYSLEQDLFTRRAFKGDFHVHTSRSDGQEPPGHVAAACRRTGLDFMAVTDHSIYAPSLEAQRAYKGVDIDLAIFPGEEVHPPGNHAHFVNFGGRSSVNTLYADETAYRTQVEEIVQTLPDLPVDVDPFEYASCVWCCQRIREAGGLAIFCHPYWFYERRLYIPTFALVSQLLETQPFDAVELLGGFLRDKADGNRLMLARYHEDVAKGRQHAIVGVSDTHGCETGELLGWYYTLVFCRTLDLPEIVDSVKNHCAVAVEAIPGEVVRAYGPFRMVKYANFLLREVMPHHDALCAEEGDLMLKFFLGDHAAAEALHAQQGQTAAWSDRCYHAC